MIRFFAILTLIFSFVLIEQNEAIGAMADEDVGYPPIRYEMAILTSAPTVQLEHREQMPAIENTELTPLLSEPTFEFDTALVSAERFPPGLRPPIA